VSLDGVDEGSESGQEQTQNCGAAARAHEPENLALSQGMLPPGRILRTILALAISGELSNPHLIDTGRRIGTLGCHSQAYFALHHDDLVCHIAFRLQFRLLTRL
jgi:hypothetical protein